jgi:hypothetical protein
MGPTALLSLRRKACWGLFRPKIPTASAGCEPANLGTKGQHATSRPPKSLKQWHLLMARTSEFREILEQFLSYPQCFVFRKWAIWDGTVRHSSYRIFTGMDVSSGSGPYQTVCTVFLSHCVQHWTCGPNDMKWNGLSIECVHLGLF